MHQIPIQYECRYLVLDRFFCIRSDFRNLGAHLAQDRPYVLRKARDVVINGYW